MELELNENVLCREKSQLTVNGVATLIGKNGSGKSIILESILNDHLHKEDNVDRRVVSFSSGQNEGFSRIVDPFLAKAQESGLGFNLNCFHFDKSWAKLLIFLATAIVPNGRVRQFLVDNGYVIVDANNNTDTSTYIHFPFRVDRSFQQKIYEALQSPAGINSLNDIDRSLHETLLIFINYIIERGYDFDKPLDQMVKLSASQLSQIPFTRGTKFNFDEQNLDFGVLINFFTQAAAYNEFIDKSKIELYFGEIEMDNMSDGEFQLLCLYAIFDLFESENTLFLIDEADSHVHYENNQKLWSTIHKVKGHTITTTHQIESITAADNEIHHLKFVDRGKIEEGLLIKELAKHLNSINPTRKFEFDLYSKLENIVIMDNIHDWVVVRKLIEKLAPIKGWDIDCLNSITPIGVPSDCRRIGDPVGMGKFNFLNELKRYWEDNGIQFQTKRIFVINDRDWGDFTWKENGVELENDGVRDKNYKVKKLLDDLRKNWTIEVHFLVWKQREIENYMLSLTALEYHGVLDQINNENLAENSHLKRNEACDNDDIRKKDVKDLVRAAIGIKDDPFDEKKVQEYIDLMLPGEISEDVPNMFEFISGEFKT